MDLPFGGHNSTHCISSNALRQDVRPSVTGAGQAPPARPSVLLRAPHPPDGPLAGDCHPCRVLPLALSVRHCSRLSDTLGLQQLSDVPLVLRHSSLPPPTVTISNPSQALRQSRKAECHPHSQASASPAVPFPGSRPSEGLLLQSGRHRGSTWEHARTFPGAIGPSRGILHSPAWGAGVGPELRHDVAAPVQIPTGRCQNGTSPRSAVPRQQRRASSVPQRWATAPCPRPARPLPARPCLRPLPSWARSPASLGAASADTRARPSLPRPPSLFLPREGVESPLRPPRPAPCLRPPASSALSSGSGKLGNTKR